MYGVQYDLKLLQTINITFIVVSLSQRSTVVLRPTLL